MPFEVKGGECPRPVLAEAFVAMVDISPQLARLFREDLIVIDGPALKRPPLSQVAEVCTVIDEMGRRSGIAQGLKGPNGSVAPVTVSFKLAGSNERLYILANGDSPRQLVGILKMGRKNLYHYDARGTMHQLQDQHAVLDFYVHEAFQRHGGGLSLFQAMLEHEETSPEMLAYDRPSPKLIVRCRSASPSRRFSVPRSRAERASCPSDQRAAARFPQGFMRKHYHLAEYVPQQNNFVVFNRFFERRAAPKQSSFDSIANRPLTARNNGRRFQ